MIEVRNLVKRYGEHTAVDHISFTIQPGHIYGFLGPNGAGKSTTMNIMTGYTGPTEGEVIIDGHNILDEPEEAKKCIGYLPETPPVYMDMTVTEYLKFAAQLKGIAKDQVEFEVERVIKRIRLEEVTDRLIGNLSKGYKQRVGLAQAIIGTPKVIILDEPTVGLDPKQIIEIRDLIRNLAKEHTVILSSHILSEVQEVCNQIIIIHYGKVLANGTPEELKDKLGTSSLQVVIKNAGNETIKSALGSISGVVAVGCKPSDVKGETLVNLKLEKKADVREAVYRKCVESGLTMLMLKANDYSLEGIFLELTKDRKLVSKKSKKNRASAYAMDSSDDEETEVE